MLDRKKFSEIMAGLAEMYGKDISEFMLEVYYKSLQDYTFEQVNDAVFKCIKTHKYNTIPQPAEILEYLEGTPHDKSMTAWMQVKEAIKKGGYYASVVFKDPIIAHAVNELGGWMWLCSTDESELPFIEKRFMEYYKTLSKKGELKNVKLVGNIEAINNEKGYDDKYNLLEIGFDEQKKINNETSQKEIL